MRVRRSAARERLLTPLCGLLISLSVASAKDKEGSAAAQQRANPAANGRGAAVTAQPRETAKSPFLAKYSFLQNSEGWTHAKVPRAFSEAIPSVSPGKISLQARDNTRSFGSWTSPLISAALPVQAGLAKGDLYCATFSVTSSEEDPRVAPSVRVRVNDEKGEMSASLHVQGLGDAWYSPTTAARAYTVLFAPPSPAPVRLGFDLMNFLKDDAATATLSLHEATMKRLDAAQLGGFATLASYTFDRGTQGWFSGDAALIFTPAIATYGGGMLKLTARNNHDCFGYWTSPVIAVDSSRIYRATMTVSSDCTDRRKVPQFRLRFLTVNIHASSCVHVESNGAADCSAILGERKVYELYIIPPQSAEAEGMRLSLDILNFDPSDEPMGSIFLDSVKIESASNVLDCL
jgi:hypothetical protein